jgi:hypothetical protein
MSYSLFEGLDALFDLMVGAFMAAPRSDPGAAGKRIGDAPALPADADLAGAGLSET